MADKNFQEGAAKMIEAQNNKGGLEQAYKQIDAAVANGEVLDRKKLTERERQHYDNVLDGKKLEDIAIEPTTRRLPSGRGR